MPKYKVFTPQTCIVPVVIDWCKNEVEAREAVLAGDGFVMSPIEFDIDTLNSYDWEVEEMV